MVYRPSAFYYIHVLCFLPPLSGTPKNPLDAVFHSISVDEQVLKAHTVVVTTG